MKALFFLYSLGGLSEKYTYLSLIIIVLSRSTQLSSLFFLPILIQHVVVYGLRLRDVDINQGTRKEILRKICIYIQVVFFIYF